MACFHGRVPEFSGATDDWDIFTEQLSHYFTASGITDADKKRAVLLSTCGITVYKLLKILLSPDNLTSRTFDELVKLVQEHHHPQPSVIMRRFRFNTCVRQHGETVAAFVARLRDLASHCEYGDSAKELIRDRLVCGIRNDHLQRSLLEVAKLTFEKAFEIAQLHEAAEQNSKALNAPVDVHRTSTPTEHHSRPTDRTTDRATIAGYRCGGGHSASDCRFRSNVCNYCKKKGHIQRVYRSRLRQTEYRNAPTEREPIRDTQRRDRDRDRAHRVDDKAEQSLPPPQPDLRQVDYNNVFAVCTNRIAPFAVRVEVDGVPLSMEIDTGASLSLISQATYSQLWPEGGAPALEKSTIRLRTYTGEELKLVGKAVVKVCFENQEEVLELFVVEGSGPSQLGRDWLSKIQLNWKEVHKIYTKQTSLEEILTDHSSLFKDELGAIKGITTCLEEILTDHSSLFKDELGTIKGITAKLHINPDARPRFFRPRSVPYALRTRMDRALEKLQAEGIIEPVEFAEWAAPIVPVVKQDGSIRVCGDYKLTVNQAAQVDVYPPPLVDDLFASLAGGKSFTKLDLAQAYQQLLLDNDSRCYVTINTHKGLFQYTRLPFGIASAPAIFQRVMESILRDLPHVCVYLDDILITGESEAAHLRNLAAVLDHLESAGIRLKREKCAFMLPEVEYLGHRISASGLQPLASKVRSIAEAPTPGNVSELKSFLGLLNYYGRFLPDLATLLAPLYELLQSTRRWSWGKGQSRAFEHAKKALTSSSLLTHFHPKKPFLLSCDASPYGVGAVLSHHMKDGLEQPIAFASRTLSVAEKKYAQLDKEALSIVFGVKHFHQNLYGRKFSILSDHKPLQYLLVEKKGIPTMASARLQRWALTLSAYDYAIGYKPENQHANADALSRLPLSDHPKDVPMPGDVILLFETLNNSSLTPTEIRTLTDKDPLLSRVRNNVLRGWHDTDQPAIQPYQSRSSELSVQDGCLLWGSRVVIPPRGRAAVLNLLHEGHSGITRIKRLARGYVWWPGMDSELEDSVKHCNKCQERQHLPAKHQCIRGSGRTVRGLVSMSTMLALSKGRWC